MQPDGVEKTDKKYVLFCFNVLLSFRSTPSLFCSTIATSDLENSRGSRPNINKYEKETSRLIEASVLATGGLYAGIMNEVIIYSSIQNRRKRVSN
jgi:hypothetical protein